MKKIGLILTFALLFSAVLAQPIVAQSMEGFEQISINDLDDSYTRMLSKDWGVVSAGDKESFNSMTISWGALGNVWGKATVMIFIRPDRYTHKFVEKQDRVSITFFGGAHKDDLRYLGSNSGRDGDKISKTSLISVFTPSGLPTYQQAEIIIEGRKLYKTSLKKGEFSDKELEKKQHGEGLYHDAYFYEVERVWRAVK
ncbi:MAG: flavin reductase [Rikenellaceae bacterium]